MFTAAVAVAALAGFAQAAPLVARAKPSTYYEPYLEPYDTYHLRYLAIGCQNQHNTTFFDDCCHPLISGQKLEDRPAECTPNDTQIASASAYISSTAIYGVPTTAASEAAAPVETTSSSSSTEAAASPAAASPSPAAASPSPAAASPSSAAAESLTTQAAIASPSPSPSPSYSPEAKTTSTTQQAAPKTTQQAAPATTTQASSGNSGANTGGYATYFYQGGNAGACGVYHSDYDNIVAIDSAWWPNFGSTSQYCGRWITVTNTNNGKSVVAQIADVCPTCANGNSLDLSVGAFTAIASTSEGQVPISWSFN